MYENGSRILASRRRANPWSRSRSWFKQLGQKSTHYRCENRKNGVRARVEGILLEPSIWREAYLLTYLLTYGWSSYRMMITRNGLLTVSVVFSLCMDFKSLILIGWSSTSTSSRFLSPLLPLSFHLSTSLSTFRSSHPFFHLPPSSITINSWKCRLLRNHDASQWNVERMRVRISQSTLQSRRC